MSETKIRILVLTSTFPRWKNDLNSGFVFELCNKLNQYGLEIHVLAPHYRGSEKQEVLNDLKVYRFKYFMESMEVVAYQGGILANLKKNKLTYFLLPFFFTSQLISLCKLIKQNHYDLVHAHWLIPQGLICAVARKFCNSGFPPVLCTSHGSDIVALNTGMLRRLKTWAIDHISHLTVVSNYLYKQCKEQFPEFHEISITPMGLDFKNCFRTVTNVKRDETRLIFVGRLLKSKGVYILLNAFRKVLVRYPDATLLVIGGGPEKKNMEYLCRKTGVENNIFFQGAVAHNDLPDYYSSAGIALVPSIQPEGFGLVTIEAMGCGCAVIATDCGASSEIINHRENGMLIEPDCSESLANTIIELIDNPVLRENLVTNARENVIRKYDWEVSARTFKDIIHQMIQDRPSLKG